MVSQFVVAAAPYGLATRVDRAHAVRTARIQIPGRTGCGDIVD
jgi:hypothetical protein